MVITHGCGRLTCQYCYGDDITESELRYLTERRIRQGVTAPAPPKPPTPPRPPDPTPMPHERGPLTTGELVGRDGPNYG